MSCDLIHTAVMSDTSQALTDFVDQYFLVTREESRERSRTAKSKDSRDGTQSREYKVYWCAPVYTLLCSFDVTMHAAQPYTLLKYADMCRGTSAERAAGS